MPYSLYDISDPSGPWDAVVESAAASKAQFLFGKAHIVPPSGPDTGCTIRVDVPAWPDASSSGLLIRCYRRVFRLAERHRLESLALPLFGFGPGSFSRQAVWEAAIQEISAFLRRRPDVRIGLLVPGKEAAYVDPEILRGLKAFLGDMREEPAAGAGTGPLSDTGVVSIEEFLPNQYRKEREDLVSTGALPKLTEEQIEAARRQREAAVALRAGDRPLPGHAPQRPVSASQTPSPAPQRPASPPPGPSSAASRPYRTGSETDAGMDILFNQIGVQSSGAGSISHGSGEPDSIRSIVESKDETFSEMVLRLIDAKRESGRFERDSDFYHKAGIDRRLFSRFRKKDYHPDKKTALCTAIALNLDEIETQALLNKAGYTLSPSIVSDLIVRYCVRNRIYDSGTIDLLLLHYGQPALFD